MSEFGIGYDRRLSSAYTKNAIGSALMVAAAVTVLRNPTPPHEAKPLPTTEQQVLDGMKDGRIANKIWNGAVVLPPDAKIYDSPFDRQPRARPLVDKQTSLVVHHPRLFWGQGRTWMGMVSSDKGAPNDQATSTERTLWVPVEDVFDKPGYQSLAHKDYNPADNNGLMIPKTITAGVSTENNLSTSGKDGGIPYQQIASISTVPTPLLEQEFKHLNLVPTAMDPNLAG